MTDAGYKVYLFEYRYRGALWSVELCANSEQEAKERLRLCADYGRLVGELKLSLPVCPDGFGRRLLGWFNKLRGT